MPPNASQTPPDGPPPNRVTPFEPGQQKPQYPGQGPPPGHNGMRGYPPPGPTTPTGPPNVQAPPRPDFFTKRHPDFMKEQGAPHYGGPPQSYGNNSY